MSSTVHYKNELVFPWDNDDFSLHLDTFPYSRLARTKSNMYPLIRSPLRQQWNNAIMDEEMKEEEEEGEGDILKKENTTKRVSIHQKIKSISTSRRRIHSSFPYNNSSHGTNPGNIEQEDITVKKKKHTSRQGRVEYISPLMSSSSSPTLIQSVPALKKKTSSMTMQYKTLSNIPPQPIGSPNRYSETGSIQSTESTETWKISQRSLKQSIIVHDSRSNSPVSVSSTRIEQDTHSINSNRSFKSYKSINIPNNADDLMLFEEIKTPEPIDLNSSVRIFDTEMLKKSKRKNSPFNRLKNWLLHKHT